MLTENDVITAVCNYLKCNNYSITKSSTTKEKGIDIDALSPNGERLCIEAKGGTSARPTSSRYNLGFNDTQAFDHVAKATYTALKTREKYDCDVALAFPSDKNHKKYADLIKNTLKNLDITVYWVDENKNVTVQ